MRKLAILTITLAFGLAPLGCDKQEDKKDAKKDGEEKKAEGEEKKADGGW